MKFGVTLVIASAIATMLTAGAAEARNTPCSGKKGGVVGCQGEKFLCRNGTLSKSKRTCSSAAAASEADEAEDQGDDEGKEPR
ncbi:hypothetical protein IHQ68_03420 [Chelatococcus sambhunathii]|uniref:Uncharacterized protein n=1 Tax=Chelatococcus sambhunathii TaxID=363953 RepID=A0ABU1DC67_9HYPH|nr:hypothetical protein [Chelatococcus sambhunathii]MDR4305672.1 hypothetical protein [Chelatococcus sambhunathii]